VEKVLRTFFHDGKPPVFTGAALPGSHPCDVLLAVEKVLRTFFHD